MKFDIDAVCHAILTKGYKIVTLQFPDEFLSISVEVYNHLSSRLHGQDISLFIAADSTYGSSLDDVSALHVESDVLVYFGSDLSSSGSVPVIVAPAIKEVNIDACVQQVCDGIASTSSLREVGDIDAGGPILVCYEASYQYSMTALRTALESALISRSIERAIIVASLPAHLDLHSWRSSSSESSASEGNAVTSSSTDSKVNSKGSHDNQQVMTTVGGLLVDASVVSNPLTTVVYIGDKQEQLTAILLHMSQNQTVAYSPEQSTLRVMQGSSSREFQQRSGGMLRVKEAQTIGIIVGSMGLTADLTQATLHRLQQLILESGRRHYTFAMGRLNEAKLSNFPEIDLFCLISSDDSALVPAKAFHVPVITPWELELGLGAREWCSVFKTSSGAILQSGGPASDEVSLEVALERVRKIREENKAEDSDAESGTDELDLITEKIIGKVVSTQGSRQLMKVSEVGTDYYHNREYKGLDPKVSTEKLPDTAVVVGQSGLPPGQSFGTMMEGFHRGNTALIDEDYQKAISEYSACITTSGETFAPAYNNRALANLQLKKYQGTIDDCNAALALDSSLEHAYYRKGLACFELREYNESKKALEAGLKLCPELRKAQYQRALRKCEAELQSTSIASSKPSLAQSNMTQPVTSPSPAPAPAPVPIPIVGIRYEYYQSLEKLCISVLAKNVNPSDAEIVIKSNHLHVAVTVGDKKEILISKQLYATIDASKSSFEVRKTKIEIVLVKLESQNWPSIEGSALESLPPTAPATATTANAIDNELVEKAAKTMTASASLPKPYASARDWNKVTSDIERELEAEKPEGEEALQKLFRDLYGKADEDTRRAMNKSFQTSGGTVLSTNWKEVSEKNYEKEATPPKGVEWKTWDGQKKGDSRK